MISMGVTQMGALMEPPLLQALQQTVSTLSVGWQARSYTTCRLHA